MPCSKLWGESRFLDTLSKEGFDSLMAELEKVYGRAEDGK